MEKTFLDSLRAVSCLRPFVWDAESARPSDGLGYPAGARVLALAPHPDDPETSAVTLHLLQRSGCEVRYTIACTSPGGVEDEYVERIEAARGGLTHDASMDERKAAVRQAEQVAAARAFGLAESHLTFLGLTEGARLDTAANRALVWAHLAALEPDIVVLPSGNDTNRTHAWVHGTFRTAAAALARKLNRPIVGLYNEDPKTTELRNDLFVLFSEELALWKRHLLRAHDSQQQRNLRTRGVGFDDRIIEVNRLGRHRLPASRTPPESSADYAEVFEIEVFEAA